MDKMHEMMINQGAQMGGHAMSSLGKGAALSAAGYVAGRGLLRGLLLHPLVMLGVGAAAGYYGYKYRKEIVAAVSKAGDAGKDFILTQKEKLSDLVEEAKEKEEDESKA